MKVFGIFVTVLHIVPVFGLDEASYKVHFVTNESVWEPQPRIYGGQKAEEGRFPFMIFALIFTPAGIARCSASLIEPDLVLIAAHCVSFPNLPPSNILLVGKKANLLEYVRERLDAGLWGWINTEALGVQERRAKQYFIHPGYNEDSLFHDLALIRVEKQFHLNGIETISLSLGKMTTPKMCTILGWGLTAPQKSNFHLNYFENKHVQTTEIGCKYKRRGPFICLKKGESGICQGDSGGPLVCEYKVWGVASHFAYDISNECGNSLEEYYSEIYPDIYWINSIRNNANPLAVVSFKNMFFCVLVGFSISKFDYFLRILDDF